MTRRTAINAPTCNVLLAAKAALAVPAGWVVNPGRFARITQPEGGHQNGHQLSRFW